MKDTVERKSFLFAVKIVKLSKHLVDTQKEYVLSKQLLRSGTIIGANINEDVKEEVIITLIATGFSKKDVEPEKKVVKPVIMHSAGVSQTIINSAEKTIKAEEPVIIAEEPAIETVQQEIPEQPISITPTKFVAPEHVEPAHEEDERKELPSFVKKLFGKK